MAEDRRWVAKDWCRLTGLCRIFNTLFADADNLYDVTELGDQLLQGIKRTPNVVKLKVLELPSQSLISDVLTGAGGHGSRADPAVTA